MRYARHIRKRDYMRYERHGSAVKDWLDSQNPTTPTVPENTVTTGGEPLTMNGEYVTMGG
jgi:hypothetical protein